jgi:hypothetical protein
MIDPCGLQFPGVREDGVMLNEEENALRERIDKMLADGLKTTTEPFPEDNHQFAALLAGLQHLDPKDLKGKLVLSGFTNHPYGEDNMRCQECMYYLQVVRSARACGARGARLVVPAVAHLISACCA